MSRVLYIPTYKSTSKYAYIKDFFTNLEVAKGLQLPFQAATINCMTKKHKIFSLSNTEAKIEIYPQNLNFYNNHNLNFFF